MTATILNGRAMSAELKVELRADAQRYLAQYGHAPGLVIVRVEGDAASGVYSKSILRIANDTGVRAMLKLLPVTTTPAELRSTLLDLNSDRDVHGIIVQMPLPGHLPQEVV